jgi:hypothetical protein
LTFLGERNYYGIDPVPFFPLSRPWSSHQGLFILAKTIPATQGEINPEPQDFFRLKRQHPHYSQDQALIRLRSPNPTLSGLTGKISETADERSSQLALDDGQLL